MKGSKTLYPYSFALPAFVIYAALFIVPSFMGIGYSFTDWNRYSSEVRFVGLDNFRTIYASSKHYGDYVLNTIMFAIVSNIVKIVPAFFLAVLLAGPVKGKGFYRTVLFLPAVLSSLVIGLIFRSVLHPATGLVNGFLRAAGLPFLAGHWLSDPALVWPSIIAVDAWKGVGYVMTIFIAGLQAIPQDHYDAADIDGAGWWRKLGSVTLPMLGPAIIINVVFGITYGLKVFDIIYVLTNGGPGRMTDVINTAVFNEFAAGSYGLSTALSTLLLVAMAVIGFPLIKAMTREEVGE
jgi:raffinose/stachyose/melibiose transport system permease protein